MSNGNEWRNYNKFLEQCKEDIINYLKEDNPYLTNYNDIVSEVVENNLPVYYAEIVYMFESNLNNLNDLSERHQEYDSITEYMNMNIYYTAIDEFIGKKDELMKLKNLSNNIE